LASSFWEPWAGFINKKNLFNTKDIELSPKNAYRRLTQTWENLIDANGTARLQKKLFPATMLWPFGG
jgi:hypothetical protein